MSRVRLVGGERGDAVLLVVEGDAKDALASRARRLLASLLLVGRCKRNKGILEDILKSLTTYYTCLILKKTY